MKKIRIHIFAGLACGSLLLSPTLTCAMNLKQMQEILGIGLIDAHMSTVLDTYGLPTVIVATEPAAQISTTAIWRGTEMRLPEGDWEVSYATEQQHDERSVPVWRNPRPEVSPRLGGLSRLVLHAKGNAGRMTVRRYPQKTTYDVPSDPFLSHKVKGVRVEYRVPIPLAAIVACYGSQYDTVADESIGNLIRYWVLQRDGEVPLSLFAVDFVLNFPRDAVTASMVSSTESDFVRNRLQTYFDQWERNLYD